MAFFELVQTTAAVSGLLCLTMVILSMKRQLKLYI